MSLPLNLQSLLAQSGPKATPLNQVIPSVASAPPKSAPASAGKPIEPTADIVSINDRDVDSSARAVIADITKYNAAFKFRTGRSIACSRLYTAYTVRDGKVRVVSNDLSGNGRLLIEDLTGCDFADMCWASASALVISATDGRIAVFLMQQELGQLTHRMVCSWRAASGEHYSSIAFASASSDHNMPVVIYAGTAAGIINALALYAPYSVVGLVNAGSCVNQLEFSPASASACACLFAATAANGVIRVDLAPSLLDRASNPVSFNPLQSISSLSAETAVQSICMVGPGHAVVSVANNHVIALIDTATLNVLQCLRVNSSGSDAPASSSPQPNVLFCNASSTEGFGHVFVSRFESAELLCFRINRQKSVPVIDWVSKQDIDFPVMCLQSAPSSNSDHQLRLVLYQTSYVRVFTIDTAVSSIVSSSSSPAAAAGALSVPTESVCAPTSNGSPSIAPAAGHVESVVAGACISPDAPSTQSDSVVPQSKPKVVQSSDVFRSAIQISSSDRTDSSTAATSNVASVLSVVLGGSATPGTYTGSSDVSPKVEDAFASLLLASSDPAIVQQSPAPVSDSTARVAPAVSSSSAAAVPQSAAAPQPAAKQDILKMLTASQSSGKPADSKKDKEQPVPQPSKTKVPDGKVSEIKTVSQGPFTNPAAKPAASASISDMSRDEFDKILQSRFEVQSSRMERELRALSDSLAKKQAEHDAHMVKSVKEAIANQVNAAVSKAVSESLKPLQKSIDALVKSSTQPQDFSEALRLATAGIVRSIGADFDSRMRTFTESLVARVESMLKQHAVAPAVAPAPASAPATEPSAEVIAFIKAGQFDNALGLTLNENNSDLLTKVLALLETDRAVPTLSQPVLLALIHCLAVGLHIQQEAKLTWLAPAVLRFDAEDPSISSHAQPVLRHLVEKIASTPLLPSTPNFTDLEAKRKKISALAATMI